MSTEKPLKSSYELAMERLAAKDREAGVKPAAPLTADQKKRIAVVRQEEQAKLAEIEILHRKDVLAAGADADKLAEIERKHQIDRERIESRAESAIAEIRAGGKKR